MNHDIRLQAAANCVRAGGVIAYPTEAVYGLGCDPANAIAVQRLLQLKQRKPEKGLILIAASIDQFAPYVDETTLHRFPAVLKSWPGPETWLLPCDAETPAYLRGTHSTLALRVTAHPIAAALCNTFGRALISTSANRSEASPARNAAEVRAQFGDTLDAIVEGETGGAIKVSRIRDALSGATLR